MNDVNFLRTTFSIEHLRWLLLIRSKEKIFKSKKKMKTFHLNSTCNYVNIRAGHPFSLTFSSNFISFDPLRVHFLCFHSLQTEKYLLLHLLVYSEAGIEMFSQTAVRQGMIRIVNFLYKIGASFSTVYLSIVYPGSVLPHGEKVPL